MIRDEFNQIEVTNDKQLLHTEFGKTQKVEFSSQNENKLPEGDLNEKYVGKTIKKVTEVNVDYVNKVPNHGASTVVTTTSSTAATAASVTAGTAVAASTVAVVAIATVTGISVAIHDYQYEFKSLIISSNELRYELYVYDAMKTEEDYLSYEDGVEPRYQSDLESESSKAPYALHVFNQSYDATQYLWERSTNMGVFDHLTLGESYNIVLSENRYGGEEIYKDTFVTYENSAILDFTVYQYTDYVSGTFDYNLDYIDDNSSISNITLEFYEPDVPSKTNAAFSIEKEIGYQTMSVVDSDGSRKLDLNKEWGYRVSYTQDNKKVIYKDDTVAFEDYAGRSSVFNDFIFNKTANFIDNSITVKIDYLDNMGWYDDFKLTLTQIPVDLSGSTNDPDYYSQEIPLMATNEPQTIVLDEYEMQVRDSNFKYTYRLTCNYQGTLTTLKEETTPFSFTDTSGGIVEFRGFEFKKEANFLNNTFKVKLDYKDDFDALYSFTLHLFPSGVNAQYDFYLEKTTDEQTCTFDENQHWNFSFDYTYSYTLTYWNDYEEVTYNEDTEDFKFTDISGGKSEFRGFTFTGNYVMSTGMAPIQLDYQDDFNYLSNFVLHVLGPISTTDVDPLLPYFANTDSGSTTPPIEDYPYAISLEKTTEVQYINLYESEIPTSAEGKYLTAVTYDYRGEEQDPVVHEEQIEFDDPDALSEVRGITFVNGEANFNDRSFFVELDYTDDYGYFSNFTLQVRDNLNGGWVERELQYTTDPQLVVIDEYDYDEYKYPVDIVEGALTYNLTYVTAEYGDPSTQYLYQTEPSLSFTNSLKSEFYGLETSYDFTSLDSGEYRLPFRLDMINDAEYFSAPEVYFTSVDDEETILGGLSFANEVMRNTWQYGSFSGYGDFEIEDMTNGTEYKVFVAYYEKDGYNGPEQRIVQSIGKHAFTLDQNQEIYHVDVENYLAAGNWEVYTTVIANGDISEFSNGEIIFQRADGNYAALAYDVTISEYMTVDLHSPKEYTVNDDDLQEYFSHPVNITFKYSKPGSSEIITISCYSNYLFSISN